MGPYSRIDLIHQPHIFQSRNAADKVVAANNADDDWTYTVERLDHGYGIRINDEDGHHVGWL